MSIEVGKTYKTKDGKRSFHIFGRKKISPTGFFYAGEETKTGLVAYFNYNGEHSHQSQLWLETDPHLYLPINEDGTVATERFVKKEEIEEGRFMGYLKLHPSSYTTITFVGRSAI